MADRRFDLLHPRIRKGRKNAGHFVDVIGRMKKMGGTYDDRQETWTIPADKEPELRELLKDIDANVLDVAGGLQIGQKQEGSGARERTQLFDAYNKGHVEERQLTGGAQGLYVSKQQLSDGQTVVVKRGSTKAARREIAAGLVANAIGINEVHAVEVEPNVTVTEFVGGEIPPQYKPEPDMREAQVDGAREIGLLDWLIGNDDRHTKNYARIPDRATVLAGEGRVVPIDHGQAKFEETRGQVRGQKSIFVQEAMGIPARTRPPSGKGWATINTEDVAPGMDPKFTADELATVRTNLEGMRDQFSDSEWSFMDSRLKLAEDAVARRGGGKRVTRPEPEVAIAAESLGGFQVGQRVRFDGKMGRQYGKVIGPSASPGRVQVQLEGEEFPRSLTTEKLGPTEGAVGPRERTGGRKMSKAEEHERKQVGKLTASIAKHEKLLQKATTEAERKKEAEKIENRKQRLQTFEAKLSKRGAVTMDVKAHELPHADPRTTAELAENGRVVFDQVDEAVEADLQRIADLTQRWESTPFSAETMDERIKIEREKRDLRLSLPKKRGDALEQVVAGYRRVGARPNSAGGSDSTAFGRVNRAAEKLPADWIEGKRGLRVRHTSGRGSYSNGAAANAELGWAGAPPTITTGTGDTAMHELGHYAEWENPDIKAMAQQFQRERFDLEEARGSQKKSVNGLSRELGYPDAFPQPYIGREYGSGSTELVSMGVAAAFEGDSWFWEPNRLSADKQPEDEEYRNWLLGLLVSV